MSILSQTIGIEISLLPFLWQGVIVIKESIYDMKRYNLDKESILGQLEELANSLEIKVRYEKLKTESAFTTGGLCKVKGENLLIINSKASREDKIETLAKALTSFDLSQVYMRPALREFLIKHSPGRP